MNGVMVVIGYVATGIIAFAALVSAIAFLLLKAEDTAQKEKFWRSFEAHRIYKRKDIEIDLTAIYGQGKEPFDFQVTEWLQKGNPFCKKEDEPNG